MGGICEGEAKSLGYNEIRLETRKVNTHAVAFYVKHNYQRIANYGPYGRDGLLLLKALISQGDLKASVQRQCNVAAKKPRLILVVQTYLKDIVCILLGCILTPRQQTLLVHADNLIGRFALIQCFDYLLQGKW